MKLTIITLIIIISFSNTEAKETKNFKRIIAVKTGKCQNAKASWWGFDAQDATKCLQNAINSGVKRLTVDNTGKDWIIGPIELRSNLELIFEDGVVIKALREGFKGRTDSLFSARDSQNISLTGHGKVILKMNKKDYQDTKKYKWSEWRMLIALRGCENINIKNLNLISSGGDGIYIGTSKKKNGCKNVNIDSVIADNNHRQGISVISGENISITNSKFINTEGTPPAAGIDFEPNKPNQYLINNTVENCEFINNSGAGIQLHLSPLNNKSKPISIAFKNCYSKANKRGLIITSSHSTPVKGSVSFENCTFSKNIFNAFLLKNQQEKGINIAIKNCIFDNRTASGYALLFSNSTPNNTANIKFDNITILPGEKPPLKFHGLPNYGILSVKGNIKIKNNKGNISNYNLVKFIKDNQPEPKIKFKIAQFDLNKLSPISSRAKTAGTKIRFRGRFKFIQYISKGENLKLEFSARKITRKPLKIKVCIKDIKGTIIDDFHITKPEYTYVLYGKRQNIYTFEINTKGNALSLIKNYPGQCLLANPIRIFKGREQRFYFHVPKGVRKIAVEVTSPINEPVSACLLNTQSKVIKSFHKKQGGNLLQFNRLNISKSEIWSINFPYAREDFSFRLGTPLLPLVATAPENLLIEE